ncbi:hypothetical protein Tco_0596271, partial [Tanacetum coccineum]
GFTTTTPSSLMVERIECYYIRAEASVTLGLVSARYAYYLWSKCD